jgi:hypothetical protein
VDKRPKLKLSDQNIGLVGMVPTVIPALRRLTQEDHEFEVSLGYITTPCLKKKFLIKK